MSDDIKAGDLVMVVRPRECCGNSSAVGQIYVVAEIVRKTLMCPDCWSEIDATGARDAKDGLLASVTRLKKIDPPAIGDSLPTRASLDTPIKELA